MDDLLTGEQLVSVLEDLRTRLNNSGVERTVGLRRKLGPDCDYYSMSLARFLKKDYLELRNLIKSTIDLFDEVEKDVD